MSALARIEVGDRPSLSLDLPEGLSFDEWVTIGRRLCLGSQALQWHIGDWWAFGDHRYGDRAKAAAEGLFGREYGSLANLASVARTFEPSRRREVLTFTHHVEVAALPAEEAEQLLEKAEREHLSTRDLRREVASLRQPERRRDVIDVRPAEPRSADLLSETEIIIELAESLAKERQLSEREQSFLDRARWKMMPVDRYSSIGSFAEAAKVDEIISELLFMVTEGDREHLAMLRDGRGDAETWAERYAITWVLRERTNASFPQIGRALNCDHSSIIRGYEKALKMRASDPDFAARTASLAAKFHDRIVQKRAANELAG